MQAFLALLHQHTKPNGLFDTRTLPAEHKPSYDQIYDHLHALRAAGHIGWFEHVAKHEFWGSLKP